MVDYKALIDPRVVDSSSFIGFCISLKRTKTPPLPRVHVFARYPILSIYAYQWSLDYVSSPHDFFSSSPADPLSLSVLPETYSSSIP